MFTDKLFLQLVFSVCCSVGLLSAQSPASSPSSAPSEFPVILEHSVVAGKTKAGTKVQAKLSVPTLFNGVVIPRNAVFSGEVIESVGKTATDPSRLAIRMDSIQWKSGSAPITVYLTAWYYPTVAEAGQNLQYRPPEPPSRTWNGAGAYPDPNSPAYKPFPAGDTDKSNSVPDTPASITSKHPVLMKNVESERNHDGTIAIICRHCDIKLDRLTTYVLATGDLLPPPTR